MADEVSAEHVVPPYTSGLRQLIKAVGTVAAPTALASALLYYFGWNETGWYFSYFGVNANVLNFSTVDYLTWSVDALFVPLTAGAVVGLVALWAHGVLGDWVRRLSGGRFIVLRAGLAIVGLLLAVAGAVSVLRTTPLSHVLAAAPLSLAAGVLLLNYSKDLHQARAADVEQRAPKTSGAKPGSTAALQWTITFVLVAVSLFWATADYSAAVGTGRAHKIVRELSGYPDAVIYSQKDLSLAAPGITRTHCVNPLAGYTYRYDGLKLLLRSGDEYLFVSRAWNWAHGSAVLLPRDAVRLEFHFPAAPPPRPAC